MAMIEIITAYQTKNRCYQQGRKANPVGILVHSTGSENRNLSRYVDAPERLGVNKYGNHWNNAKASKCMHGFIGRDKDKKVIAANTLPYEFSCWGAGKGSKGSANYDPTAYIQFEICQGSKTDSAYYGEAIGVAAEYCAYLCRKFGWSSDNIISHKEAHAMGLASNHGDPESYMRHFDDNMDKFRARVDALLGVEETVPENSKSAPVPDAGAEPAPAPDEKGGVEMPTVKKGTQGTAARVCQRMLIMRGCKLPRYGADGKAGDETVAAIKAYQTAHNLTPDGICGPLTWAALAAG